MISFLSGVKWDCRSSRSWNKRGNRRRSHNCYSHYSWIGLSQTVSSKIPKKSNFFYFLITRSMKKTLLSLFWIFFCFRLFLDVKQHPWRTQKMFRRLKEKKTKTQQLCLTRVSTTVRLIGCTRMYQRMVCTIVRTVSVAVLMGKNTKILNC